MVRGLVENSLPATERATRRLIEALRDPGEDRPQFVEPEIELNGKKHRFDSFQAMKDSSQFKMLSSVMRLFGRSKDFRLLETFLDMKIAEENGERHSN